MTKRISLLLVLLLSSTQLFATIDVTTVIDSTWNEVLSGSQFDPGQDTQAASAIDLLGGTSPLLYMKYDDGGTPGAIPASNTSDDEIGFRFRADNAIKSGNYDGVAWIGIDVDSDATIDAFMLLVGKNGNTTLDVYDAGTGANNSPSTTSLGSTSISVTTDFVSSHGLVSVIDPTSSPDVDADSDPDSIISFKVNFDALATALSTQTSTTITIDTAFKFVIASAVNSNTLNGDIGGFDSTSDQSTTYADQGAFTSEISASSGGDVTAPLAPTVDLLATSDLGTSDTDDNTSDTTPTLRVSLDQTGELATNAIEGDIVKLFEGVTQVGTATLTATDISNGYVDITSSALSEGSLSFTATVTDQTSVANASEASAALSVSLDTTLPTVAITLADSMLTKGETSLVTFTFSEEPYGFANGDVTAENGTLSAVTVDGTDAKIYTATFTPTDNITDSTNVISVGTGYADAAGNTGTTNTSANYEIDTTIIVDSVAPLAPTIDLLAASDTGVSSTDNNTSDTTPTFRVTFDQSGAAATDTVAGDTVKLFEGMTQVGSAVLTATDISNGYVDITSSALSAGSLSFTATVTDTSANVSNASSTLAVSLDTTAPTLTVVMADTALIKSETSVVTFTFSEAPAGFANGDVTVTNGTLSTVTVDGSDPKIYTALFTPTDNIEDATNIISVSTAYTDTAGNTGTAADSANYTIDTTDTTAALAPTIDLVAASDLGASNTDNITSDTTPTFRVTFDQSGAATTDTVAGDIVKLYEGVTQVGSATLTATDISNGYVDITSSVLSAGSLSFTASVTDTSANVSNPSSALAVSLDATAPTLTVVLADIDLIKGETSNVTFTFSEDPDGFAVGDVTPANGGLTLFTVTADPKVYTALFTPADNVADATNIISVNTAYTDEAGNTGTAANSANYTIDTLAPTLTVVMADTALIKGETSLVTFSFSEAPTGFANGDVTVANGTLSTVTVDGSDPRIYTATFTPTDNVEDATNIISVSTAYTDGAGNTGTATNSVNYTVDTLAPTLAVVMTDTALIKGETSLVTFTFSEAPTGFANGDVTVANGTLSTVTVDGSDPKIYTSTFTPTDNLVDATNIISVSTAYTDAAGNTGTAANSANYTIDTTDTTAALAPTIDLVAASDLGASNTDNITSDTTPTFRVTFDQSGAATTDAVAGDIVKLVEGVTQVGSATLTATDISNGYVDITSSVLSAGSLSFTATVTDTSANVSNPSIALAVSLDTTVPTLTVVMADSALIKAETSLVTFTFSEAPTGFANGDVTVANGTLSTVTVDGSDPKIYTATFTPTDNVADATNIISVSTAYTDGAGNTGTAANSANYTIDTLAPTLTVVMADAALIKGETSVVTFTFSETPTGFANGDVTVANGTLSTVTVDGSDPKIYTATFTPTDNVEDATNIISVSTTYTDGAGNTGTAANSANYTVDTRDITAALAPSVDLVAASDLGASSTDNITSDTTPTFRITFDQSGAAITDTVAGDIVKLVEGVTQVGTATLTATDISNGYVDITSSVLNAGSLSFTATVTDTSSNVSNASSALAVSLDTTAPTLTVVMADTALIKGETSLVTFTFSEAPTGFANGDVTAANGTLSTVTVNGTDPKIYTATFTPTDNLVDASNVISVSTAYTDVAGNTGTAANSANYTINTSAPTLTVVMAGTALIKGETSLVTFTFSEAPTGFANGDVTVANGTLSTVTVDGSDPKIYTATFTPTGNVEDATNIISVGTGYTDSAGNTGTAANSSNYTIDTLAPVVVITSAPSATAANASSYPVSGNCSAGDGNVTVSIVGVTASQSVVCTAGSWGPGSFDVSGIADGVKVIDVNASQTDSAGNTGNALLVEADKDTVLPVTPTVGAISDDTGRSSSDGISSDNLPVITGTWDEAGATILSVTLGTTTYGLGSDAQLTSDGSGNWTLDLSGLSTALADGAYDLDISTADAAGNVSTDTNPDKFVIDTIDPTAPTVVSQISNNTRPTITGTAEAGATVTIVVGGATYNVLSNGSGDWTLNTATASPDSGTLVLLEGDNTISVTSADASGNSNASAVVGTLTLDAADADNDGIPDSVECPAGPPLNTTNCPDSDGDGIPNYLDTDSDNDGISDAVEAGPNPRNPTDTDGGGNPNYIDADSDNDGISDANEKGLDEDGDGIPDYVDLPGNDFDGDGIPDSVECPVYPNCADTDLGGQPDYADIDSDNDGISDAAEAGLDPTKPKDTDGDGLPDYRDTDSDNDGLNDTDEVGANPLSPVDTDGDGIPDYLDAASGGPGSGDSDGDGIADSIECVLYPFCADSDADGTPDYMETDSDNDRISDGVEARVSGLDDDGDGIDDTFDINTTSLSGGLDLNNDGIDDTRPLDSDGDGLADYQDADSDNDGVPDAIEVGGDVLNPTDTDGDGIPDYLDVASAGPGPGDSDGDGIDDAIECPAFPACADVDADGIPDYLDSNHDDGPLGNIDGDSRLNYLDPDDDGDGVPDAIEDPNLDGDNNPRTNPVDTDGDGIHDYQDTDSDNDGIIDTIDAGLSLPLVDTDSDGIVDIYDADADGVGGIDNGKVDANGDGIDDLIKPVDVDGDGIPDFVDVDISSINSDSDGDGIPDLVECPSYPACPDSDGDRQPDYMEVDSDNDAIGDRTEFGALTSGNAVDSDGDGLPDYQDKDSDNDGISDAIEGLVDNDGDGIPDYVDVDSTGAPFGGDSDGDGVPDMDECISYPNCADSNSDGTPDYMDASSTPYDVNADIITGLKGVGGNGPWSLLLLLSALMFRRPAVKVSY